ncbi:Elongation factor P hydroxylase [Nitrosospira sp. Nsp1]|nr:Elongation factor P hydroxylase [Nitrosospira sp. Nsp1]
MRRAAQTYSVNAGVKNNTKYFTHSGWLSGLRAWRAAIREQGEKAFYRPSTDEICLPERNRFASEIEFYSVALHELTHWTGAKHRLARDFGSRFGTEFYAFED